MPININGVSVDSINDKLDSHEMSIDNIDRTNNDNENLMLMDVISGLILTQPVTDTHVDIMRTSGVYGHGEFLNRR